MKRGLRALGLLLLALLVAVGCGRANPPSQTPPTAASSTTTAPASRAATPTAADVPSATAETGSVAEAGSAAAPNPSPASQSAAAPALPEPDLGYNAREGRALFLHYCATCHGAEGHGDGFNAFNLDPKPRDLGDPGFQTKRTDDELVAVVRGGGAAAGLSTGMPPWGRTLGERQIRNLVVFLRTLKPTTE